MRTLVAKLVFASTAVLLVAALAAPETAAYCLTGVRWPADANVYYNPNGKITSGQCISGSAMDSAVSGQIGTWSALINAGTTTKTANKRDGQNTVGWANLGGQTLGITNYLNNDRFRTVSCGGNLFANLYEADIRLATAFRWTSTGTSCPCAAGSAFYLNAVAQHELGHEVGLCHTSQPSSLMYPSFGVCENKSKGSDENAGENALCY